jgi:predicted transcriptional regulator
VTDKAGALISLHRRFADAIFDGRKTVELRTRRVNLAPDTILLIYVTTPDAKLEGWARVDFVDSRPPNAIWRTYGSRTALSRSEFDAYASDKGLVSAIGLKDAARFEKARSLATLRRLADGFHPPQFMALLDAKRLFALSGFEPGAARLPLFEAAE